MIPGFSNAVMEPGHEAEGAQRIRRFMTIMDSMTDKELDATGTKILGEQSRRAIRGCGGGLWWP